MNDETAPTPAPAPKPRKRFGPRRALAWAGLAVAGLVVLFAAGLVVLNTGPGRAAIAQIVSGMTQANGLQVRIGRIDGSIYSRMTVRDLELRDPKGVFASSPEVTVDWRPLALLGNYLMLREASSPLVTVARKPELKPGPPRANASLLPGIDITVGKLDVQRIVLEAPVTGRREIASVQGSADILKGHARIDLDARAQPVGAAAGGDVLRVKLDAVPDEDKLDLDARLNAPAGGVVATLAGLDRQLVVVVAGKGSWKAWNGLATARLGGEGLLNLGLTARDGHFAAKGQARPSLMLDGPAARLTEPALSLALAADADGRKLQTDFTASSAALRVAAKGLVDLDRNRFGDFRTDVQLLKPGVLAENVAGRNLRASVVLDGPFSTARVDYDLAADALSFGDTTLQGLHAQGRFRLDPRRMSVPVHATSTRVTGVPEAVGGVLRKLRADGDLVIAGGEIASDNLRIRSDQIDATLVISATPSKGRYDALFKGRLNRYRLPGVGVFGLTTNAHLATGADGRPVLTGDVRLRSLSLENPSLEEFLGGQFTASGDVRRGADGAMAFSNLRIAAPKLNVTGSGRMTPQGRITFAANGRSEQYGPLALTVAGPTSAPVVRLSLPQPNLPVPVTEVEASLTPKDGAYLVTLKAASPYGPLDAEASIAAAPGPLTLDLRRAELAGLGVTGKLAQTEAGPFAGTLTLGGDGLSGTLRLSAQGAVQRADAALKADKARFPSDPPLLLDQGSLEATALLYPDAPVVTGRLMLADLRAGEFRLKTAKADIDYRAGAGQVQVDAEGAAPMPFTVAAAANLTTDLVRVTGQGAVNGVALRVADAAEIRRAGDGWILQPTTIALSDGQIRVSGRTGETTRLSARITGLDLAVVQAFAPEMALGGVASGAVQFDLPAGGGFPTGRAQIDVKGLSRTGVATTPAPVDVAFLGALASDRVEADAVVRRRGAVVGRLQARLSPGPASDGDWIKRILDAPLTGGLRYNGPAEVLWALSGVAGQEVSGPVAVGADFTGRLTRPQANGVVRAKGLRYHNQAFGTVIDNIVLESRFTGPRLDIQTLQARAGRGGSITASGYASLSADDGFPIDVKVRLDKAQLARSDDVSATASGELNITNSRDKGALVTGRIALDEARYRVVRQGAADVIALQGVRRRGEPIAKPAEGQAQAGPPSNWKLDVDVVGANQLFVTGMGLESEWRADLSIKGAANQPQVTGEVHLVRGTYSFAGRRMDLSRGVIRFTGESAVNPQLDLQATSTVEGVTTAIDITGQAQNPQIAFSSTPSLPQDEILSRLLFGSSVTQLSPTQALQLAAALNSLRGGGGGLNPLGELRQATGFDRLNILGADEAGGRGTALSAGKYISNDIYVEVVTDTRGFTAVQLEIALSRSFSILSQVSSFGGQSASLRYSKDY